MAAELEFFFFGRTKSKLQDGTQNADFGHQCWIGVEASIKMDVRATVVTIGILL